MTDGPRHEHGVDAHHARGPVSGAPEAHRRRRPSARRDPFQNRAFVALALIAVSIVGLCVVVIFATSIGASIWNAYAVRAPGGALAEVKVGRPAPDFELEDLNGDRVALRDYRGQPVLVNFWATWCSPCVAEIPLLNDELADNAHEGLVILAVDVEERPSHVAGFAARRQIDFTVLLDPDGEVAGAYHIMGMPTSIWVDADGMVRHIHGGSFTPAEFDEAMAEVLTPLPTPESEEAP